MKISFIILIIYNILYFIKTNYIIHELEFYQEHEIDVSTYDEGYIPSNKIIYFRIKSIPDDILSFQFKVLKKTKVNVVAEPCGYPLMPSDFEVIYGAQFCKGPARISKIESNDPAFDLYSFPIETTQALKYIVIYITNFLPLKYLSVYVKSKRYISKSDYFNSLNLTKVQLNDETNIKSPKMEGNKIYTPQFLFLSLVLYTFFIIILVYVVLKKYGYIQKKRINNLYQEEKNSTI